MASAHMSDEEASSESDSDVSDESDSDNYSDLEADSQLVEKEPCKYYNSGGCRNRDRCAYLHVCKYALKGNCHYGSKCKLNHNIDGGASSGACNRPADETKGPTLTDGRLYQWQLNDGKLWKDVDNDHIIEAQYSLPHTKSMTIYNTPHGSVTIDFNRMRVWGKSLRVRRLDDGKTVWHWYCTLRRKWRKYGDKDSKGNPSTVKSSDIERKFQSNPESCFTFSVGSETLEIRFKEMQQVGRKRKRRVARRPLYQPKQTGAGTKPQWQFEGNSGDWHEYKYRKIGTPNECSVNSDEIERKYQQNPTGSMMLKVNGHQYKLDFKAMTQINLKTKKSRRIKRVSD